jgi:hypothetical protein
VLLLAASMALGCSIGDEQKRVADPISEWSVREGYSLTVKARGLSLPTALAAVPGPQGAPDAPRVFVTELRGEIKVLTNAGQLRSFAKLDTFVPAAEWPNAAGEAGLAGICLEPEHGYVFVTYAYRDKGGVLRNAISRFSADPKTFTGPARDRRDYAALLAADVSSFSHQIGTCAVEGDALYVGVGDGGDPSKSHDPDSLVGKMLRLTLDGAPHPKNPLQGAGRRNAVFATGLRNPFGVALAGGRVFAAENGVAIDRFLEVREGQDHRWDGTDASIAMNALAVFNPTIGPAQMVHAGPARGGIEPGLTDPFLIAASDSQQGPGVVLVDRNAETGMLLKAPTYLAHFEGKDRGQGVVGVALADEGLYFTPILPVGGSGVVLLARYDPPHQHARVVGRSGGPLAARGCLGCHSIDGVGGSVGPMLDTNSLLTRVESHVLDPSYASLVARLDGLTDEALVAGRAARHEVLAAQGDERVRAWLVNRLMNPRFDNPDAAMPNLGIRRAEAEALAETLMSAPYAPTLVDQMKDPRFLTGAAVGLLIALLLGATVFTTRHVRRGPASVPASTGTSAGEAPDAVS